MPRRRHGVWTPGLRRWGARRGRRFATPTAEPKPAPGLALAEIEGTPAPSSRRRRPLRGSAGATAVQAKPASAAASPTNAAANPYAPPAAPVSDPAEEADESAFIPGGRSVPAGRGWSWFAEAWGLFKESPLIWIVNFLVFMFVLIAIEIVPLIGSIIGMLVAPVLRAGIMIGARAVHQGEPLEVGHLFAGFRDRTGPLVARGRALRGRHRSDRARDGHADGRERLRCDGRGRPRGDGGRRVAGHSGCRRVVRPVADGLLVRTCTRGAEWLSPPSMP